MQIVLSSGFEGSHHSTLGGFYFLCKHFIRTHASAPHMSPHLGRLAGMMGEVPSRCGRTEGKRERRREILVRTVSRWPSRFPWSLDFPDWTRRSSLRAAGCGDKLSGRHGCHSMERTEAGSTQGRCRATRTQSPRPLRWGKRSRRGAHTWARLGLPLLPTPCSRRLRSPGRRKGDGPTLAQRFLV